MPRKTLRCQAEFAGVALHSGGHVRAVIAPAAPGRGIVFRRMDRPGTAPIPALWNRTCSLELCTAIGSATGDFGVSTIEHLMAALAAAGVDDAEILVEGAELPILDGSAAQWLEGILAAGLHARPGARPVIQIVRPVRAGNACRWAQLLPGTGFALDCSIDFAHPLIGRSACSARLDAGRFRQDIAPARTFVRLADVEAMHRRGLALGGSLDNAIVLGEDRVLNPGGLRFPDEFVRHKLLDAVGDLKLAGAPIQGRYAAHCPGHALNNMLLRTLMASPGSWRWLEPDTCSDELPRAA